LFFISNSTRALFGTFVSAERSDLRKDKILLSVYKTAQSYRVSIPYIPVKIKSFGVRGVCPEDSEPVIPGLGRHPGEPSRPGSPAMKYAPVGDRGVFLGEGIFVTYGV